MINGEGKFLKKSRTDKKQGNVYKGKNHTLIIESRKNVVKERKDEKWREQK